MEDSTSNKQDFATTSSTPLAPYNSRARGHTVSTPATSNTNLVDGNGNKPTRRNLTFATSSSGRPVASTASSPLVLPRRPSLANTVLHYTRAVADPGHEFHTVASLEHEATGPLWDHQLPGAEPGIDTTADIPEPRYSSLVTVSQTSLVDFSPTKLARHEFNGSEGLLEFLEKPREDWAKCRWINVNGLDWKIIKAIGNKYKLHRLAIEDLIAPGGRAKVDWYPGNVYILLHLQKLVRRNPLEHAQNVKRGIFNRWRRHQQDHQHGFGPEALNSVVSSSGGHIPTPLIPGIHYKTIQRYRGDINVDRDLYMERNSPLTKKNLAVSIEKVSIFLTDDNTVIAFFEQSADDIEPLIRKRLDSVGTILRKSADASMMFHGIIDAMTDLFFAVSAAYEDIISELELDILQDPSIEHSRLLYILQSELTLLRNNISPLASVLSSLRDHRKSHVTTSLDDDKTSTRMVTATAAKPAATTTITAATEPSKNPQHGNKPALTDVSTHTITPLARTYLGDVEDNCILILQNLDTLRNATTNMISLIYNQMGAIQNETMAVLTYVTIFFLPLTFLTGYFGQNFKEFPALDNSDKFFWYVAIPIMCFTIISLSAGRLQRYASRMVQKLWIRRTKESRRRQLTMLFKNKKRAPE